jgi:hypothetical protein
MATSFTRRTFAVIPESVMEAARQVDGGPAPQPAGPRDAPRAEKRGTTRFFE